MDGKKFVVKGVLAIDSEGDLAMLQVDVPKNLAIPLNRSYGPARGESIVVTVEIHSASKGRIERDRLSRA